MNRLLSRSLIALCSAVFNSLADISKARELLGYEPTHRIAEGLKEAMDWYVSDLGGSQPGASKRAV